MKKITGIGCNDQAKVDYLIKDEHHLFDDINANSLFDIMDEDSDKKLSNFLTTIKDEKATINWEMNVIIGGEIETLFFSGLFWMDKYLIQMSSMKAELFFYPQNLNQDDIDSEILSDEEDVETSSEKFNDISRFNNELTNIQRELTKKNRQLEKLNERLEILATTDSLTGIFNRRAILNHAETELERASREDQTFTLAILDLNDFKGINDTYGHQTGDKALKLFAECLQQSTRNYDGAGRIGGDEFLVYFSLESGQQFKNILERLLTQIKKISIEVDEGEPLNLNASIGGVFWEPGDPSEPDIETMMGQADKMLYQAKNDGERSIVVGMMEK